jgi:alkylhydroperoxidase family enzyme
VSDAQIAALERGETPADLFSGREQTAFTLADEVLETSRCADDTFAAVRGLFSPREVVELLSLIGYFRMICGLMTTLDVESESPFGVKILNLTRNAACGDDYVHAAHQES